MKASDTVMPLEYSALGGLHCAGVSDEKILRALKAQAEISFKAGIKEAVEWVDKEFGGVLICDDRDNEIEIRESIWWQSKLKEWGCM